MARNAWRDWEIEAHETPAADRANPTPDVPRAIGIHFGAQPGWGPDREGQTIDLYETPDGKVVRLGKDDKPDGLRLIARGVCPLCHSAPGTLPDRVVCGVCGRCSTDDLAAAILARHPAPRADVTRPVAGATISRARKSRRQRRAMSLTA